MVYEAERLINKRFGCTRKRWVLRIISHFAAALFGMGVTLAVVLLIRKI